MTRPQIAAAAVLALAGLIAGQDQPKKKPGFLDRMNEKLDKLNRKLDPNAPAGSSTTPAGDPPAGRRNSGANTGRTAPTGRSNGAPRTEPCTNFNWTPAATLDPLLSLSPQVYQKQYEGHDPAPPETAGVFSLDSFGKTQSIQAVFAPRRYRVLYKANGEQKIVDPRDPSPPFETHFTLSEGRLFAGFCNEKGQFRDAYHLDFISGHTIRIAMSEVARLIAFNTGRPVAEGGGVTEPFCPNCYFLNKVFVSGTEMSRYVILVNPDKAEYWVIQVQPWYGDTEIRSVSTLCKADRGPAGCDGAFEGLEARREPSDSILFPGKQETIWYVRCGSSAQSPEASRRCSGLKLSDVAGNRWH